MLNININDDFDELGINMKDYKLFHYYIYCPYWKKDWKEEFKYISNIHEFSIVKFNL